MKDQRVSEDELLNSQREGWCGQKGKLLKIHYLEISFSTEHICALMIGTFGRLALRVTAGFGH